MKRIVPYAVVAGLAFAGFAPTAAAKSQKRTGLNFGTTVRSLDTNEASAGNDPSTGSTTVTSSIQGVNPYVGYAWTYVDLGLVYEADSSIADSNSTSTNGASTTDRRTEISGRGLALFARYLFGNYFFFEGGVGGYQETIKVSTLTTQGTNTFTGQRDTQVINGVGPSYHVGGGIELNITGGFYFTTAYEVRIVQLRDDVTGTSIGQPHATSQKNEVLFGLAYYDGTSNSN